MFTVFYSSAVWLRYLDLVRTEKSQLVTKVSLCSRILLRILLAALRLAELLDLQATVSG